MILPVKRDKTEEEIIMRKRIAMICDGGTYRNDDDDCLR